MMILCAQIQIKFNCWLLWIADVYNIFDMPSAWKCDRKCDYNLAKLSDNWIVQICTESPHA